ncbi:hypothetical protein LTR10_022713 [Elasticomyces elasticus]|uniref:DUF7064 domain-containing protein n=1 Tax=Exophiala sideris TaxID=1016849 RepID=A0ABR0IVL0_9EURO|nr:hypothetical protein LTR10_022713 [Elasticomyces elasticus]KAK5021499.1 hypothetical protein LTS07_011008 [Exophiala sideris]KAK5024478.1 hypothetical protein LTR13_010838 [Exophiala sideris]KAK5049631.1 hypothetical protein LTR69_011032 [Exophiala sideris]KAK5176574.1 hypothetical protein LTR44_010859 [Eurotiomycetes sp. CCFEE 6388]
MYLAKDSNRAIADDWGGLSWASPMRDAAYFLGNGLTIENRRKWEKDLLHEYLNELNEYRLQSIYGLAQHITAAAICAPTERGEIMFHTLASRQAQHALDMDAISLVTSTVTSHSPDVADESQHVSPDEAGPLWNESWYFDCTSADGEVGMYARLGRLPNQGICIFVGGIFRRNKEPVMFVDMHAPLPVTDPWVQQFSTSRFKIESRCLEPLKRFSLQLSGTGSGTSHPSSLLPENYGIDVTNMHVELVWNTSGLPYMKKGQTRYEVACSVTGTITVPGNRFDLNSAPGQRNHSWGIRNWWVADWVWSGLHFPDGTDVFTIALGKGPQSTGGSGYIQKDKKLTEVTGVVNEFEWKENGMPGNLQLHVKPGAITIECESLAESRLRLFDPEGREADLLRIMCRASTGNGKLGVGRLDFNRVLKS